MKILYKVLSYVGFLWILGLLLDNNDKKVRFHVGQGMILTVFTLVGYIVIAIIQFIIKIVSFGLLTFLGRLLYYLFMLYVIYLIIIGIANALENKQKELPTIGKYAFYK